LHDHRADQNTDNHHRNTLEPTDHEKPPCSRMSLLPCRAPSTSTQPARVEGGSEAKERQAPKIALLHFERLSASSCLLSTLASFPEPGRFVQTTIAVLRNPTGRRASTLNFP